MQALTWSPSLLDAVNSLKKLGAAATENVSVIKNCSAAQNLSTSEEISLVRIFNEKKESGVMYFWV